MFENLKILIVGDDSSARRILVSRLIMVSFKKENIKDASDPFEALEILTVFKPDVIITDYYMPGMNGLKFVRKLKVNPEFSKIPIVFYTRETSILSYARIEGITDALKLELSPSDKEIVNTINQAITK
ncbi:MAG: response regulator [Candidatus Magasanikbacteria bacterium]|nr:response regulator [Candidatus Magasanikbacteria bacterium]